MNRLTPTKSDTWASILLPKIASILSAHPNVKEVNYNGNELLFKDGSETITVTIKEKK